MGRQEGVCRQRGEEIEGAAKWGRETGYADRAEEGSKRRLHTIGARIVAIVNKRACRTLPSQETRELNSALKTSHINSIKT